MAVLLSAGMNLLNIMDTLLYIGIFSFPVSFLISHKSFFQAVNTDPKKFRALSVILEGYGCYVGMKTKMHIMKEG
jgi:hypothetical protein